MNKPEGKAPSVFTTALIFILLNAAIWLVFAIYTVVGAHPSYTGDNPLRWIFTAVSALVGGGLVAMVILLRRRSHMAYFAAVIALFGIAIIILFDQVGTIELVVMIAALIPLVLLLLSRRWYFSQPAENG